MIKYASIFFTVLVIGVVGAGTYSGGDGTAVNPYQIETVDDLFELSNTSSDWASHFILIDDIAFDPNIPEHIFTEAVIAPDTDAVASEFQGTSFTGVFNGNGHTIFNLKIYAPNNDFIGLFGNVDSGGRIKNLRIQNADIKGRDTVGVVAGRINNGLVFSCSATGQVIGNNRVGGLVGVLSLSFISTCNADCSVSGSNTVGGIVGGASLGYICSSYAEGQVSGTKDIGGLVGGHSFGVIVGSHASGTVNGQERIGGLVGVISYSSSIYSSYALGDVYGGNIVGGLVGEFAENSSITTSYSTGFVSGNTSVGGLVGKNSNGFEVNASFWDTQTSGRTTSAGGTGRTTSQMKTYSTFVNAGWDFSGESQNGLNDYWVMPPNDYPRFASLTWTLTGEGTSVSPYNVADASDLGKVWLRPLAHYRLVADIDLTGISWSSAIVPVFNGYFDGRRFIISKVSINLPKSLFIGLFGTLFIDGTINNLGVVDVDITGGTRKTGGIAGENYGTINASHVSGVISAVVEVGGLVGMNRSGLIQHSYSITTVNGLNQIGGLVGVNMKLSSTGTIVSSYSMGAVNGDRAVGGLVGSNSGKIIHSYSTGKPTGTFNVGGLCGWIDAGIGYEDRDNFWDIETSGIMTSASGVGKTTSEMKLISTFIDAGWDLTNETANGIDNIWRMCASGVDYPLLNWQSIKGDLVCPDGVNIEDIVAYSERWLMSGCNIENNYCGGADLDCSGKVDLKDLAILAENWLN